jgi:hypothetical protein
MRKYMNKCSKHLFSEISFGDRVHETWWSYRYMFLVGPKVFSFVVKGVKVIF